MENTKQPAPVERIQGKGLRLSLSVFKKLKAFQAGGQYWEHQSQNSIREYMGDFLPLMQVEENGESVMCQMFVEGKEVASQSRAAKGISSAQRQKLELSIQRLKDRASAPDVDSNVKKIIEAFKLPDPRKDPELYRLYGSRWNPKLMVVWGCEKEEGTSLPPEEASHRVVKESAGGTFVRKLPIILLVLILLGALVWFISNSDFSKQDEVADGKPVAGIADSQDTDNDGIPDAKDAFPNDPSETADTDGDGTGNNADTDDDNDGTADNKDAFPLDSSETADVDGDGVGDNSDAFPSDSTESADTDGDGEGDNADTDDDNDGTPDTVDTFPLDETDGALTIEEGPANEDEIQERRKAIQEALDEGEAVKPHKPARIAEGDEVNLAKLIKPAVVTIVVSENEGEYTGQGTGFIITENGILVTNHHVVKQIKAAKAVLSDGRVLSIEAIIASDASRDLALLKLPESRYPFLRLADKDEAEVGDKIAVMGSPQGLRNTYSTGIISAERPGGAGGVDRLQISAPVSPGSSGSPVVNEEAKVVGIVQGGITGKHAQALNLAIDVAELHEMLAKATNSDPEVEISLNESGKLEAQNEKAPETIPDEVLVPKKPVGGKVSWQLSPGAAVSAPTAPVPVPQDARLELAELSREVLANGKIKITLKAKIREEEGELNQLKGIDCTLDNKKIDINGSMLTMICDEGAHILRITWIGQSGKKHAINRDINIQVIRVE